MRAKSGGGKKAMSGNNGTMMRGHMPHDKSMAAAMRKSGMPKPGMMGKGKRKK
jgi:hypothetical protein